jgi:hypothetical protein
MKPHAPKIMRLRITSTTRNAMGNPSANFLDARLITILFQDVDTARNLVRDADNSFNRRSLFRAFFAAIEGTVFMFKRIPLETSQRRPRLFSQAELSILTGEAALLRKNGNVAVQQKFQPTPASLRFLAACLVKVTKKFPAIETDQASWAAFQRCVKVRNRVVHPKKLSDVAISDAELRDLHTTDSWFRTWAVAIFRVAIRREKIATQRIEQRVALLNRIIESLKTLPNGYNWNDPKSRLIDNPLIKGLNFTTP